MDEADIANELAQLRLEQGLSRIRAAAVTEAGDGICVDCDEDIPPARMKAKPGALRCISCQEDYEYRI